MYIINVKNGKIFNTDTLQVIWVCYESLAATLAGHKDDVVICRCSTQAEAYSLWDGIRRALLAGSPAFQIDETTCSDVC